MPCLNGPTVKRGDSWTKHSQEYLEGSRNRSRRGRHYPPSTSSPPASRALLAADRDVLEVIPPPSPLLFL